MHPGCLRLAFLQHSGNPLKGTFLKLTQKQDVVFWMMCFCMLIWVWLKIKELGLRRF